MFKEISLLLILISVTNCSPLVAIQSELIRPTQSIIPLETLDGFIYFDLNIGRNYYIIKDLANFATETQLNIQNKGIYKLKSIYGAIMQYDKTLSNYQFNFAVQEINCKTCRSKTCLSDISVNSKGEKQLSQLDCQFVE